MAVWNEQFYKGTDVYSDGDIEDTIYSYVKDEQFEEKREAYIGNDFTLAYHLSPIRENILNWYPFSKEESAIEIGAGCGAITGVLCERLGKVVSVDLSKRRSRINYERHKKYDNLEIFVGNFNDIDMEQQYDYVILNGVLEYALSFTDSKEPYQDFLRHIARFLKPDGRFLIAIENKLGLKYFSGAQEDHTGNYFLGLNGYEGNDTVRTFTKSELRSILEEVGFVHSHFYYPYPDYKFPNEIFTDETLSTNQYGRPAINIENGRYSLFNETMVGQYLCNENVRDVFANSFLVEASRQEFETSVLYAKMNMDRRPCFQIGTVIEKDAADAKYVRKFALNEAAKQHIVQIQKTTQNGNGKKIVYWPAVGDEQTVYFAFLTEENLDSVIEHLLEKHNVDEVISVVEKFFTQYQKEFDETAVTGRYQTKTFEQFFGTLHTHKQYPCVKCANIDLIMDNIYLIRDRYIIIDGEWIYEDWIPYTFIVWRSINELYTKHTMLKQLMVREEFMQHFGISAEDEQIFQEWADYFAREYVGSNQRGKWAKEVKMISLDAIHQQEMRDNFTTMSLYLDYGQGYSEEGKLYQDVSIQDGRFEVVYHIPQDQQVQALRFDPDGGSLCRCSIDFLTENYYISHDNADYQDGEQMVFIRQNPQISLQFEKKMTDTIRIAGSFERMKPDEIREQYHNIYQTFAEMERLGSTHNAAPSDLVTMAIYVDYGEGFSEEGKQFKTIRLKNGEFKTEFYFSDIRDVKGVRFDPVEGEICRCAIDEVSNGFFVAGNNADETIEGQEYFVQPDPQYYIQTDGTEAHLVIRGFLYFLSIEEVKNSYRKANQKSEESTRLIDTIQKQNREQKHQFREEYALAQKSFEEEHNRVYLQQEQLQQECERLRQERDFYALYANNTKSFLKRKIKQKLRRKDCE